MKILHILLSLEYGGAERVSIDLIRKMQGDGLSFSMCVLDKLGDLKDELSSGIQINCLNREGLDLFLPFRLAKVIKRIKPDIIHMHNGTPLLYGAIAARLSGIDKMIVTQHGSISKQSKKMQFVLKRISGMVNKTVAVSKDIEEYIKNTYRINGNRLEVVINGIDEEVYKKVNKVRTETRGKLGLKDEFIVGHVARLSLEKDQSTLLKAFSRVTKEIDRARLVIVGDGFLKDSLKLQVEGLKLGSKVLFLGTRNDVQDIMNIFDVFVLSSIREGTSLTLLEAMATELPIVATNVGGNSNVVRDGENGFIVPVKDIDALAERIVYLYKDPDMREKMGKLGRKRIEQEFSLKKTADRYTKIYREL